MVLKHLHFILSALLLFTSSPLLGNIDSLNQQIEIYKENGDTHKQIETEIEKVRQLLLFDNKFGKGYKLAEKVFKKTIRYSYKKEEALLHYILGFCYVEYQSKFDQGIHHYFEALAFFENSSDLDRYSGILLNISNAFYRYKSYNEAIKYNNQGLKIAKKINDPSLIASFYSNLGSCYSILNKKKKALKNWNKALSYYASTDNELSIQEIKINILSTVELDSIDKEEAQKTIKGYKTALKIFEKYNALENILICHKNLGTFLNRIEDYQNSRLHLQKALHIAERQGNLEMMGYVYDGLANNYHDQYDYKNESLLLRKLLQTHDSLFAQKKAMAIEENRTKFETDKKEKENQILKQEKEIQEAKHELDQIIKYGLFIGIFLIVIFLLVVINRFLKTRKQKFIIEKQKNDVDEAYYQLEAKNNEILDSIVYAQRIQKAILPDDNYFKTEFPQSFVLYQPKDIVAGDFYWMKKTENSKLLAVADCTGHGVPGAMVSVICNNGLNRSVKEFNLTDPGKILDKTKEIVIQEFEKSVDEVQDGMDIALCALQSHPKSHSVLQYAGANNPLWVIRKGSDTIEEYMANKQPIGKYYRSEAFKTHHINLDPGDTFYLFSDGYVDQFGGEDEFNKKPGGKKFKSKNLKTLLLAIQHQNMEKQKEMLFDAFRKWKGDLEQLDDVCIIGVRI